MSAPQRCPVTAIPHLRDQCSVRMIDINTDHIDLPGRCGMCSSRYPRQSKFWQSGAGMRDNPLPAAPVFAGRSR